MSNPEPTQTIAEQCRVHRENAHAHMGDAWEDIGGRNGGKQLRPDQRGFMRTLVSLVWAVDELTAAVDMLAAQFEEPAP